MKTLKAGKKGGLHPGRKEGSAGVPGAFGAACAPFRGLGAAPAPAAVCVPGAGALRAAVPRGQSGRTGSPVFVPRPREELRPAPGFSGCSLGVFPGLPPPRTLLGRPLLGLESRLPKGWPMGLQRLPRRRLARNAARGPAPQPAGSDTGKGAQPAGALLRAPSTRQGEREWGWAWGSPSGARAPVCPVRGWDGSVCLIPSTGVPAQAGPVGIFPLPSRGALTSAPAARTARLSQQGPRICHGICPPPASLRGLKARRRGTKEKMAGT